MTTTALVTTGWLAEHLGTADLRVADATFFLPGGPMTGRQSYEAGHIEGAVFFDIDTIADGTSDLPHMLPSAATFADAVGALGIGAKTHVVLYDANKFLASARAWWMFRVFGHANVSVLDGGLQKWRDEGRQVTTDSVRTGEARFAAGADRALVCDLADMRDFSGRTDVQIVDMRPAGRFAGTDPEPRPGLRPGHIPGSRNVPSASLVRPDGTLKREAEARALFAAAGVDLDRPIVTTCGSGVSAAVAALALHDLGLDDVPVYDGSWSEWGALTETPVEP